MAKKSMIAKDKKRRALHAKNLQKRNELKQVGDADSLHAMTKQSSPTRLKNRCAMCGRPRAYMRHFGICRVCFRQEASKGNIPGVTKASW